MSTHENDPKLPNYRRPEVIAAEPDLTLMRDVLAGTRRMWDRSAEYIRKWADEKVGHYNIRRVAETFFEGTGRVLSAAVGMLFSKAPAVEWNESEAAFSELWANIDASGTAGPVLIKRFAQGALRDGIGIILTDHPQSPSDVVVTAANEPELGLRPAWAIYSREQAISWRTGVVNNKRIVTQIVLSEAGEEQEDGYGVTCPNRFRVIKLDNGVATWTLYEQTDEKGNAPEHFKVHSAGVFRNRNGKLADFLPVSVAYAGMTEAPMQASIPLLGVAWANLAHWQTSTDLRYYRMLCAYPQPVVTGELKADPVTGIAQTMQVGPGVGIHLAEGGTFEYAELTGTSLEQLVEGVKEKLEQIGQMGMSFLVSDTRAAETAEAKRLDATSENATLATAAQGIEDAVNLALEHAAWFLGIEKASAPVVTINRDFDNTAMDAAIMGAYGSLIQAGFPKRVVLEALQAGGRIPADADLDELELEWSAGEAAATAQKEMEREEQINQLRSAA